MDCFIKYNLCLLTRGRLTDPSLSTFHENHNNPRNSTISSPTKKKLMSWKNYTFKNNLSLDKTVTYIPNIPYLVFFLNHFKYRLNKSRAWNAIPFDRSSQETFCQCGTLNLPRQPKKESGLGPKCIPVNKTQIKRTCYAWK